MNPLCEKVTLPTWELVKKWSHICDRAHIPDSCVKSVAHVVGDSRTADVVDEVRENGLFAWDPRRLSCGRNDVRPFMRRR